MRKPVLLCLSCLPASADLFNHKIVLVGDKGAALGGAFTGLADDATATYYNPAGLTQIKNIKLNVSAQVVQYQKQKIGIADGTDIPYNSFNFSPHHHRVLPAHGQLGLWLQHRDPAERLFTGEQKIENAYRESRWTDRAAMSPEGDPLPCYTD